MFRKIVCPIGLDELSFETLSAAADIAAKFGANLVLLHLDDKFLSEKEMVMLRTSAIDKQEEFRKRALSLKQTIQNNLIKLGLAEKVHEIVLREGSKETDIPREAEELGGDLIIVHSSGRDKLVEKVTGSTSESILKHAKIPLLVIFKKP